MSYGLYSRRLRLNFSRMDNSVAGVYLALELSISTLNLLVRALLDFPLQNPRASGLVEVGDLEDVGRIDPVVFTLPHNMLAIDVQLVNGNLIEH